tara:strand:- start:536 stop:760 length:225 start_codon:yes stop_codon:yes gene_type:complete
MNELERLQQKVVETKDASAAATTAWDAASAASAAAYAASAAATAAWDAYAAAKAAYHKAKRELNNYIKEQQDDE